MKSINLPMTSVEVKTETRALRANWTTEMVQDLSSYHGVSLEKELERILRIEKRKKSIKNIFPEQKP
jgi:uncharacterized coiled-coil DUF342 family protein